MERKYYIEFLKLFNGLDEACSIISGKQLVSNFREKFIELIERNLAHFNETINTPSDNVMSEIEENLYKCNDNRETYIMRIIRDFKDISSYLLIESEKEYNSKFGLHGIQIGSIFYSPNHVCSHQTLERYSGWKEPMLNSTTATNSEKYIIKCFSAYRNFFNQLDALCLDFGNDLMEIQKKNKLQVWIRDSDMMSNLGYGEMLPINKNLNPESEKSDQKPEITELKSNLFSHLKFAKDNGNEAVINKVLKTCKDNLSTNYKFRKRDYAAMYLVIYTKYKNIFKANTTFTDIQVCFDEHFGQDTHSYKPNDLEDRMKQLKNSYVWIDSL